jgi:hypothetical protein
MKKYSIAALAFLALTVSVVAGDTEDFSNLSFQCNSDYVVENVKRLVEHSPMGHLLGVFMVYMKDQKELSRSKDELRCQAKVFLNTTATEGMDVLIRMFNQDGHTLIMMKPLEDQS